MGQDCTNATTDTLKAHAESFLITELAIQLAISLVSAIATIYIFCIRREKTKPFFIKAIFSIIFFTMLLLLTEFVLRLWMANHSD